MKNYQNKNCAACNASFQPTSNNQWRCPSCKAKKLRPGPIPLCACGCGKEVKGKKGGWNKYVLGHGKQQSKTCAVCGTSFPPTNNRQLRCSSCINKNLHPGPIPLCGCGCGDKVKWRNGKWTKYKPGHHTRLNNPRKKGSIPWNKGTLVLQNMVCKFCGKKFKTRDKRAKFCSPKCYHQWNSGENNVWWTGGKPKTKYKDIQVRGIQYRVHRKVMEEFLGRKLRKFEIVHHIDEDGLNNSPENLHVFHCDNCHRFYHRTKGEILLQYEYPEAHKHNK